MYRSLTLISKSIPDGKYPGIWGGYTVKFDVDGVTHEARSSRGIRTSNAECVVTVQDDEITVETI